ncbi:hypothetical protein CDL15_Pgr022683 [Punica granatum]|uniref:Uncharacterized protein n=1 Tax=Punica granatum TaxID=22663 RepID=A0A218XSR6_PUNGR|nr:hypothetical protein CDL15_Pgr022683 [Punica granatum]PKI74623.1 hypothetical protein CRG98_004950 [Punica granatum]
MVAEKIHHQSCGDLLQLDRYEETEDTLSLCDLPIYGDFKSDEWSVGIDSLSKESPDQDFFEFSSQDLTPSQSFPSDNVVFCGKIIPYKQPDALSSATTDKPQKQRVRLSRWKSLLLQLGFLSNRRRSGVDKYKSLQNSRWYLFVFGVGRLPMEMELRDIKTRQSRLKAGKGHNSTMFINGTLEKKSPNHHRISCMPLL